MCDSHARYNSGESDVVKCKSDFFLRSFDRDKPNLISLRQNLRGYNVRHTFAFTLYKKREKRKSRNALLLAVNTIHPKLHCNIQKENLMQNSIDVGCGSLQTRPPQLQTLQFLLARAQFTVTNYYMQIIIQDLHTYRRIKCKKLFYVVSRSMPVSWRRLRVR